MVKTKGQKIQGLHFFSQDGFPYSATVLHPSEMMFFRNMASEPSVFWCPSCKAKLTAGKRTDVVTCTNCGTDVDVEALRSRIAETWNALEQEADQLQVRFVPFPSF